MEIISGSLLDSVSIAYQKFVGSGAQFSAIDRSALHLWCLTKECRHHFETRMPPRLADIWRSAEKRLSKYIVKYLQRFDMHFGQGLAHTREWKSLEQNDFWKNFTMARKFAHGVLRTVQKEMNSPNVAERFRARSTVQGFGGLDGIGCICNANLLTVGRLEELLDCFDWSQLIIEKIGTSSSGWVQFGSEMNHSHSAAASKIRNALDLCRRTDNKNRMMKMERMLQEVKSKMSILVQKDAIVWNPPEDLEPDKKASDAVKWAAHLIVDIRRQEGRGSYKMWTNYVLSAAEEGNKRYRECLQARDYLGAWPSTMQSTIEVKAREIGATPSPKKRDAARKTIERKRKERDEALNPYSLMEVPRGKSRVGTSGRDGGLYRPPKG